MRERGARYAENCAILLAGMRGLGFRPLLPEAVQAPIIVTFLMPDDPRFMFEDFYESLRRQGYVTYPGKLTAVDSFRIGCIGHLGPEQMHGPVAAVRTALAELGISTAAPLGGS